MNISIENLTKIYGNQKAVDQISFEVKKGEILGFLGPNGAGKTTTMKMITTYLSANSGDNAVAILCQLVSVSQCVHSNASCSDPVCRHFVYLQAY